MAMRTPQNKREHDELVAYLYGMDAQGNLTHLFVYKKGDKVRFTGELIKHDVGRSNSTGLEDWVREAETACGLDEVLGVARGCMQTPENLEKFQRLNVNAAKKRKEIEASSQL